jgi:hypothetical protein
MTPCPKYRVGAHRLDWTDWRVVLRTNWYMVALLYAIAIVVRDPWVAANVETKPKLP